MLVVIRGAGDLATGVALRLWRAHIRVVMTEIPGSEETLPFCENPKEKIITSDEPE